MTRCCSHCSHNGHNSRTCPNRGVKIFGVRLTDGLIRKSASMGNLSQYSGSNSGAHNGNGSGSPGEAPDHTDGYASENFVPGSSSSREMKKRVPWTEEEHRMFLFGLQKLGKGDWRGISRNYVISRTPTQVLAMLKNISSGSPMFLGEKDVLAFLILWQMNQVTLQWYHHRICFLQIIQRSKHRAMTSCLFLLHGMKKINQ